MSAERQLERCALSSMFPYIDCEGEIMFVEGAYVCEAHLEEQKKLLEEEESETPSEE